MNSDFCIKCDNELSVYCGPCYDKVAKELNDLIGDDDAWRKTYEKTHAELLEVTKERDEAQAEVERLLGLVALLLPKADAFWRSGEDRPSWVKEARAVLIDAERSRW